MLDSLPQLFSLGVPDDLVIWLGEIESEIFIDRRELLVPPADGVSLACRQLLVVGEIPDHAVQMGPAQLLPGEIPVRSVVVGNVDARRCLTMELFRVSATPAGGCVEQGILALVVAGHPDIPGVVLILDHPGAFVVVLHGRGPDGVGQPVVGREPLAMLTLEQVGDFAVTDTQAVQREEQPRYLGVAHAHQAHEMAYQQPDIGAQRDRLAAKIPAGVHRTTAAANPALDGVLGDQVRSVVRCEFRERDVFLVAVVRGVR